MFYSKCVCIFLFIFCYKVIIINKNAWLSGSIDKAIIEWKEKNVMIYLKWLNLKVSTAFI